MTPHVLTDCEGTFATLRQAFPQIASDADWWVPVQAALLRTGDTTILVDTGAGPKPRAFLPDGEARLLDDLAAHGVAPQDVDIVVNTHLHIDHVGWNGSFPNARYVVPKQTGPSSRPRHRCSSDRISTRRPSPSETSSASRTKPRLQQACACSRRRDTRPAT